MDDHHKEKSFSPESAGTKADLRSKVNMDNVYGGFFSSPEPIKRFIEIGIKPIVDQLPDSMSYGDFGGGTGIVTRVVAGYLLAKGKKVRVQVIDANQSYLEKAKALGLEARLQDLNEKIDESFDLITMRSVLHYNSAEQQRSIVRNVWESLNHGGYFVHQNLSGSDELCELQTKIMEIPELGRGAKGSHHWVSEREHDILVEECGFTECRMAGRVSSTIWSPEDQWDRFNPGVRDKKRKTFLTTTYSMIDEYVAKHGYDSSGIFKQRDGTVKIHGTFPIYICRK